jgi:hypothetical protein
MSHSVMLSVVMLNVIMLSVMAPFEMFKVKAKGLGTLRVIAHFTNFSRLDTFTRL